MTDTPSRMFGLVCVLIGVWVLVYWLYQPSPPRVTADTLRPTATQAMMADRPLPDPPIRTPPSPPATEPSPAAPAAAKANESPATPPKPTARVVEPQFRKYIVQQGDISFEVIAQKVFKDRKKWTIVAQANPYVSPDRLKPGKTVLNIPLDEGNIQGKVEVEHGTAAPPVPAPPETSYVIQREDTLWDIAVKVYGKGKGANWRMIYDANKDVIKNPDRPPAGATIRIPTLSAPAPSGPG